ncbi:unnamed protein product [Closterium sp. NIES-53]
MDTEMASWKSTGTYVNAVPPSGVNIVNGKWIFRGSLHEEIWLRRPPGFTGSFPAGTQWSLRQPVYGLRQAPCEWHDRLSTTLTALGFAPSTADMSLFLCTDTSLPSFYVLVYVDDLVFATADIEALTLLNSELQKRHTCTDLGEIRSYLGLQITRDRTRRTITLTQSHMVHQVFQRFGFRYSSPQSTPLPTGHSLSAPRSDESVEPSGPYPELVGCLMYLMTCTRPDLAYPLSILACYVAPRRHRPEHWEAAKRVLRYLCSTSGMELVLGGRGPVVLTGHADASWRSTRSSSVLSSSCEAEIYAGAMVAQELRWLTYLLADLGERPGSPPVLYQRGQLRLAYVATRANIADIFTKALQSGDHQPFCTVLGLLALHFLTGLVTTSSPPLCLWGCGGGGCVVSPSPPPPFVPTAATAAGGEGVRVWGSQGSGIGVAGVWSPVPILLLSFPLLQLPLGGGCEGVEEPGEWHWGGGCETNQQPSRHLSSLPPSAAPAAVWGGGGGGG